MNTGLLWFDDDPRKTLAEKVERAVAHYVRKYRHAPDLCYVHPSALGDSESKVSKVGVTQIRAGDCVLVHHFWLGVDDDKKRRRRRPAPQEECYDQTTQAQA